MIYFKKFLRPYHHLKSSNMVNLRDDLKLNRPCSPLSIIMVSFKFNLIVASLRGNLV